MKKWIIGFIVVLIIAGIAFIIFGTSSKGKKMHYAKIISKNTGLHWKNYINLEEAYLKSRATAMQNKLPVFMYNGSTYNTSTGKKVV
jgi:uncharacterized protein YxeA